MTVKFLCEHCHKEIKAPDSAAGKQGKCPYCGESNYIPAPAENREEIPLAPIDEASEQSRVAEVESLRAQERELLHALSGEPEAPLEHKEDLRSEDLRHFVVNYCMDMFNGDLQRADVHVRKLKKFKFTALEAVEDFRAGKVTELVLSAVPKKVLQGYLADLKEKLR